ncbi:MULTISPECIES: enoyl-CoA hydratase-related protein [Ensifer]|jgi:enoyl-CoA hydratase/carnithine racemase|uniref:enoyl-CoA hydratase-related protein n=1 Tax=Ensifer TaxID=106591 RepID=UPI000712D6E5|nr:MULTISPECIES: enoyl-CoA hydratase-related protein [Ensifer]KQX43167.1 3-hydroxybutyryl-CoA dehydratase [Ensifer sp. Root1298]KQX72716.1 3-hydroxybutyryl-CoA dehydratase [Ensifer sp. Root1312]KRC15682.1 3-hydroxybutyryl-CoA dehydratase [Ensifer sp. Root74]KRD58956.1 3-hydroxybutyryl-CoA dehydratase [Ensifer sp. Root954]
MSNILVENAGGVALVTLNRPQHRNAVTYEMWQQLADLFERFNHDSAVRSIILTGAGADFSAGADISEFEAVREGLEESKRYEVAVDAAGDAIYGVSKPTIAVLRGYCLGGAAHLAMSCDFRIAESSAVFGIPAARLSIVYGVSATRKLFSLVGVTKAKRILYTGRRFNAEEALALGFVDEIAMEAQAAARDRAAEMAESAPLTIKGAKFILNGCARGELNRNAAERLIDEASASHDYVEGRKAFKEKRSPRFLGR